VSVFFEPWETPFGAPPFAAMSVEAFGPAFERALADHRRELADIAHQTDAPTFENTILALERAGRALERVAQAFEQFTATLSDPTVAGLERDLAPVLARHAAELRADPALFARVEAVHAARDALDLDAQQRRLLERHHLEFVRAGARLDAEGRARLERIMEALAERFTRFRQNMQADEDVAALVLTDPAELEGLPADLRDAAATEASARGLEGAWVIANTRSSVEPFLQFSERRDLRRRAFEAWVLRGDRGPTDNKPLIREILTLRQERARLLGYETFAAYKLADTMAGSVAAAEGLLRRVWGPAVARATEEARALEAVLAESGADHPLEAWDWRFAAEKLRRQRFALDDAEVKPYFQLDRLIAAAFDVATRLFGVTFHPRTDIPTWHPDVRVWEVRDADTRHRGLFYGDYFARSGKRSGAWMTHLRSQERLTGDVTPHIVNVCNFLKGPPGRAALLSLTDARTLFHEFGHGLHGLLSDVTYPSQAGTRVAQDFVELPSQLYEHWLLRPEVLRRFARHVETDAPIPDTLIERILSARHFNQGFATVEFCASALVDMAYHAVTHPEALDPARFEAETLSALGMPRQIVMRHRSPHFAHIFSGDDYAAGYYSYLWSEVLDADGFDAFLEAGDVFDAATAARLRQHVYSAGDTVDPAELYRRFRGRDPGVEPLLAGRGLSTTTPAT
jgi:peptidyl-dipeptidase Dcp